MSLLIPIISLGAFAGAAFWRPRREANGHDRNPPRVPREDLPAIMAALEDPDPSVEVLTAAIVEAERRGLSGAKSVFNAALRRAVSRQADPEPAPDALSPIDLQQPETTAESTEDLFEELSAAEDLLGEHDDPSTDDAVEASAAEDLLGEHDDPSTDDAVETSAAESVRAVSREPRAERRKKKRAKKETSQ